MINSLEHAKGVILQWYDEVTITQHEPSVETLPSLINHACDYIANACNSGNNSEQQSAIRCLFGDLIEPWNDSFTMRGRNAYARIFGRIVWTSAEQDHKLKKALRRYRLYSEEALLNRHKNIRKNKSFKLQENCQRIVVLSRVTIGADILLTNVLVQRLQQKYPEAKIVIIGDKKLNGLFGAMRNVRIQSLSYARRGSLTTRLHSWIDLCDCLNTLNPDLVIAPDSRLDQLGMLPVISDEKYLIWENLQINDKTESLSVLLDQWACEQLDIEDEQECYPKLAFDEQTQETADHIKQIIQDRPFIAVKLDYGGNADKAVSREWEIDILRCMIDRGWSILIDRGFGEEELNNSDAIMRGVGMNAFDISESDTDHGKLIKDLSSDDLEDQSIVRFYGSIAAWAACAQSCQLAFSYDSVGHHLAAALEIPLVIAFTGYKDEHFPTAWQPRGTAAVNMVCIPQERKTSRSYLDKILDHITKLTTRIQKD